MYGLCGPGVDIESCVVDEDGGLVIDRDDLDVDGRRDRGLGAGPANDGEAVREGVTAVVNVLKEKEAKYSVNTSVYPSAQYLSQEKWEREGGSPISVIILSHPLWPWVICLLALPSFPRRKKKREVNQRV